LTAATRLKTRAPAPTLLTTTPTFVMYRLSARVRGQRVMEVPLDEEWDLDERAMQRAVEMAEPNVIFIASPNNPTGTMVNPDRLQRVIEQAPNSLVVVDEAYVNYADRTQFNLLERYENVAILRTLSKVGFASLRVGWMIGHESLITELNKVRLPYNIPTLSQSLAHTVLSDHMPYIEQLCETVRLERARVAQRLLRLKGVTVVPSQANFLWMHVERPASEIYTELGKKGVLVRSFHGRGGKMEHFIRVTIGTSGENDQFLEAMADVI
jgi:histidinol-phosphate aminotransferase